MNRETLPFIQIFILCNRSAPFSLPLATIYIFIIYAHANLYYFKFPLKKRYCETGRDFFFEKKPIEDLEKVCDIS